MSFTTSCCEHSGFYQLQKVRGRRWTDAVLAVSCAGSGCVSTPHRQTTVSCVIRSVLIGFSCCCLQSSPSCLQSSPSCLQSSPSCSSPSQTTPPPLQPVQEAAPGPQRTGFFALCPPSTFPALPHTHSVSSCAGSVGVLSHPVCSHWSLCLRPRSSAPEHRRWKMGPAIPSCSSRWRLSSHSPQWVLITIYELPPPCAVNAGRHLSPVCSVAGPLHLLCLLPGCFPR